MEDTKSTQTSKMEELIYMHDHLFKKFVPCGRLMNFYKEGKDTYVIMYIDDADKVTPYKVRHMTKDGLFGGCSETSMYVALLCFRGLDI